MEKLISIFGLPYLDLIEGDTQLVAVPNFPLPNRTLLDQARDSENGFTWRNYTIINNNHIGGADLGEGWLLYIDPNQTVWYLKLGFEAMGGFCKMSCSLERIFGRFDGSYPPIQKPLVQADTVLTPYGKILPQNRFTFERKSDGSEVLIHVYAFLYPSNTIDLPEAMSLYEIWKLELTGSGHISQDEQLGQGISAKLTKYKSYDEIQHHNPRPIAQTHQEYRVGKVNITERYEPEETIPPECKAQSYTMTFDLRLVPNDNELVPFMLDRNNYQQTNWHGQSDIQTAIVRMLYEPDGHIKTIAIKKENQTLRQIYQGFKGQGSSTQNIEYIFKHNMCVLNGNPRMLTDEHTGVQVSKVSTRIIKRVSLIENDEMVQVNELIGETSQQAHTTIGQPVVNSVNVKVTLNGKVLRDVTEKPGVIPSHILKDPFSENFQSHSSVGISTDLKLIFVLNNRILYAKCKEMAVRKISEN